MKIKMKSVAFILIFLEVYQIIGFFGALSKNKGVKESGNQPV